MTTIRTTFPADDVAPQADITLRYTLFEGWDFYYEMTLSSQPPLLGTLRFYDGDECRHARELSRFEVKSVIKVLKTLTVPLLYPTHPDENDIDDVLIGHRFPSDGLPTESLHIKTNDSEARLRWTDEEVEFHRAALSGVLGLVDLMIDMLDVDLGALNLPIFE
jgi:hypothetical protein